MTGTFQVILHKKGNLAGQAFADLSYPLIETETDWVLTGFSHPNYLAEFGAQGQSEVYAKSSLDLALRTTRAGGRVALAGLPVAGADRTPVWFRELELTGAYTSGIEHVNGDARRTFDLAIDLAADAPLEGMVGATYPLSRWRQAIDHALDAGRLGTMKVAFDPQER